MSKKRGGMDKLLWSAAEVALYTGLCRTTIWRMERLGDFPARRQVSPKRVAWVADEVREWVKTLPVAALPPLFEEEN